MHAMSSEVRVWCAASYEKLCRCTLEAGKALGVIYWHWADVARGINIILREKNLCKAMVIGYPYRE